jgi:lipopolysaccharide/colanic/teichoic acid biosynthesis glycosyltransferase
MRLHPVDSLSLTRTSLIEYFLFGIRLAHGIAGVLPSVLILSFMQDHSLQASGNYVAIPARLAEYLLKKQDIRALLVLSPLVLRIAVAVKLDSPGPVLFRQKRNGYDNRLIEGFKFRSMHQHQADATAETQTTRDDARVTRVGRFIRRTSLDELPQLFNVVAGTMSMVGPRPHATATKAAGILFEQAVKEYTSRHRVKPGITGLAQIHGFRGETDTVEKIEKRVEFDLEYIENWSVWFDLYILLRTVPAVLFTREAY